MGQYRRKLPSEFPRFNSYRINTIQWCRMETIETDKFKGYNKCVPRKAAIIDSKVRKFIMSLFFKERAMKQKEVKKLERIVKIVIVTKRCI